MLTRKKSFRTAVQRAELVEGFKRSGLTRKAFANSKNVPVSTLNNWLKAARRLPEHSTAVLFREMKLPAFPVSSQQWAMEVVGPDGLMVRCREALPIQDLAWLLRGR